MTPQEVMARALANAARMDLPDEGDMEAVEAQITALESAGYKIVPVEITETMRRAAWCAQFQEIGATPDEARSLAEQRVDASAQRQVDARAWRAAISAYHPEGSQT